MRLPYATSPLQGKKLFSIAHFSLRDSALFFIFLLSLQPYSIEWGGSGVSASYFFLLLFVIPVRKIALTKTASRYIYFYFFIFIAGFPALLFEDSYYLIRTTASFLAFISPLSLLFIRFKKSDLALFVYAVILSSLYYSINSIEDLVLNYSAGIGTLKSIIGTQHYGFVLCLGFFLAFYEEKMGLFLKFTVLLILLFGMLLTYSRSTIISLSLAFILLVIESTPKLVSFQKFKLSTLFRLLTVCMLSIIVILVFQSEFKGLLDFFSTRLILPFLDGSLYEQGLSLNKASSEGFRLYLLKQIFEFLLHHPLTGSNFSGLYLLFPEYGGVASAHNQYADVLLRTGLLGFGLYSYLIIKVLKFFRQEKGVLFGLIAILFYSLFHETFKIGYGGFIFGFLLSYRFWLRRQAQCIGHGAHKMKNALCKRGGVY